MNPPSSTLLDRRFAILVSRYNESITGKLLAGAVDTFSNAGFAEDAVDVFWVPGAWELSVAAAPLARSKKYAGVVCLGAVIKGETTHDQHINRQLSVTLGQIAVETEVPVLMGVLTVNSLEQAIARSGGAVGNKGVEAAEAALEMAGLMQRLRQI